MKRLQLTKLLLIVLSCFLLSYSAPGNIRKGIAPVSYSDSSIHSVDPRFVGKWRWTKGSDGAYFNDNGVYQGPAYGMALQYTIRADGFGSCFNHIYSTMGIGSTLEVNISSTGFFESDDQGHLGYFPTAGTYKSSSGENRALRADELWNTEANTGKSSIYQKVVFTKLGGRDCFQVTSSNGIVDTYFKVE